MATKAELHQLVDAIPDSAADEAARRLAELRDPVLAAFLTAPEDDEPTTPEDLAAIQEGRAARARGGTIMLTDWRRRPTTRGVCAGQSRSRCGSHRTSTPCRGGSGGS
jgi:hypothetical protein